MATFLGAANWRLRSQAPTTRLATAPPKPQPLWPTFSLVFLLCLPTFFAPIAVTVLNATLVGLAGIVIIFNRIPVDKRLWHIAVLVLGTACLGLMTGTRFDRYEYLKDFWYVTNPLLVMLTGYVLFRMKPDLARVLRAFVVAGVIVALWQSRGYLMEPSIVLLPAVVIRNLLGTGSPVPILALCIIIISAGCLRQSLRMPAWLAIAALFVLSVSVAGTFSRTAIVLVGIAIAALAGCFVKREWIRIALPAVVLIFGIQLVATLVDTESSRALESFGGKLLRSVTELTSAGTDIRSINLNFRAYETDRVQAQFLASEPLQMILGQGFGATVDLGITMPLAVSETGFLGVRHIGIFHNGYMFLLTKVGVLGLILYVAILLYMYLVPRRESDGSISEPNVSAARLLQMVVVSLAATTYIVGGIFNRDGMFPFLLLAGCLLAYFAPQSVQLNTSSRVEQARKTL